LRITRARGATLLSGRWNNQVSLSLSLYGALCKFNPATVSASAVLKETCDVGRNRKWKISRCLINSFSLIEIFITLYAFLLTLLGLLSFFFFFRVISYIIHTLYMRFLINNLSYSFSLFSHYPNKILSLVYRKDFHSITWVIIW